MTDKLITHEEAIEAHARLFDSYLDGCFVPFPTRSDLDTIKKYITQQEQISKDDAWVIEYKLSKVGKEE